MAQLPDFDLYEELQISPNASREVVQAAFRRLARVYHPDAGSAKDPAKFSRLSWAYSVLTDPDARAAYDAYRYRLLHRASEAHGRNAESTRAAPVPSVDLSAEDGWWPRIRGWVIGIAIVGAISFAVNYVGEQDVRSQVDAQNQAAARAAPPAAPVSGNRTSTQEQSESIDVFDVRVGNCVADAFTVGAVESLRVVPCSSSSARGRATYAFAVARDGGYPDDSYFDSQYEARCPDDSDWFLFPTAESWRFGDRTVTCFRTLR